jgi:hypothetical protein
VRRDGTLVLRCSVHRAISGDSVAFPALVLILLIAVVFLPFVLVVRTCAIKNKEVPASYFKLMGSDKPPAAPLPPIIEKSNRHLANLFELPPVFLALCALIVGTGADDGVFGALGWAFVGFRILHAAIHLTCNHVIVRLLSFLGGVICVVVMAVRLIVLLA